MGLSEDEQKKAQQHRIESRIENGFEETSKASAEEGGGGEKTKTVCCQENESSSCCQNLTPNPWVQTKGSNVSADIKSKASEKKGSGKESKVGGKVGTNGTPKAFTTQTWFENWERDDTYAALAVVGAIASIAVAYSCYRQSR